MSPAKRPVLPPRHRNKKPIYTYLETDQVERLDELSARLERPKAELIREAVEAFLKRNRA